MYLWTDGNLRVHGLTCVMALLFLSLIYKKMKEAKVATLLDRAMEVLPGIRLAHCYNPRKNQPIRKIFRLSSTEQKLITSLNIEIADVSQMELDSTCRASATCLN